MGMLQGLAPELLQRVVDMLEPETMRAGDVIFAEGEFGEKIYIIESGHVSILIGGNEVKRIVAKVGRSRLTLSNPS